MPSIQDRRYKVFLAYSECDADAARNIWQSLRKKGLNITHHTDPDGPFVGGKSAYQNMADSIENSDKTIVYLSKSALESGFVCLEIMLAVEKTQRTGRMAIEFIAERLSDDEVEKLKPGLLTAIRVLRIDMNRENWEEQLIHEIKEERRTLSKVLPVGNLAHGQVFSHYCGYLQHILPGLEAEIQKCPLYKKNPHNMCLKYFMLIPLSCNTEILLEGTDRNSGIAIEQVDVLKVKVVYAGKDREYSPTIYKATKGQQSIYFIGEYPKVLYSVYQIKMRDIAGVDERLEANRFYHAMNNLLNHRNNPLCNDKCMLIRFADDKFSAAEVLWDVLSEELKQAANRNVESQGIINSLSNLRFTDTFPTKYTASVSCLSDDPDDRKEADSIATYLQSQESTNISVITRDFRAGNLEELCDAKWNIFIMSRKTFEDNALNIELVSAICKCATNRTLQVLPVVTRMDIGEVPNCLKWVTTLSTNQPNYQDIILKHIVGQVVHMNEQMPAGDVSTGLGWAYLLNYLNIQLGGKTDNGFDFFKRIQCLLQEQKEQCGCLPRFYVILSSTGQYVEQKVEPVSYIGKTQPIIRKQAGTKNRTYYMHMHKYTFEDESQVCYMSEVCTAGYTLNTMATELPYAGIRPGEILTKQIRNLGDVIEGRLRETLYKESVGDFTERFCLIRYDVTKGVPLGDVIKQQLKLDLKHFRLITADSNPYQ